MFYFKSMETDARRVNNWKAQGPRLANYSCFAAAQWADGAKAGRSLCRVCFVGRAGVDTIIGGIRKYISWVKHSILSFSLVNE